jgi:uncharacterized YceG family protein
MAERSADERERARAEREARRQGRPAPPPEAAEEGSVPSDRTESRYADSGPITTEETPPATGREWRRVAGEPDPDPPLVRRVAPGAPREQVEVHDEPLPEALRPDPPGRRIPPPPSLPFDPDEQAIGTKRVAAGHRIGRPHLPHRKPRAPAGPTPPSARRTLARRVAAVLALAALAFVLWFAASLFQPFAGDGSGTVVVTIPKGATVGDVGDILASSHVVSSSFFFGLRARLDGKDSALNSGRLTLERDMSYAAALDALTQPAAAAPRLVKLTIPEGRSRIEIAETTREAGIAGDYLAASRTHRGLNPRRYGAPRGATLEGFLFPATYDLRPGATVDALVTQQLRAFRRTIAGVDLRRARSKNLTAYDVLVIASMIEREAGIAKDRRLISAVIYNRLKQGMPLGIDATLRYRLRNWTRPLKVSELESSSRYNTRKHLGLPPTPIGNPGLASIEAAAHPARVDYLFYVVRPCGDGAHNFSATDAEFQRDVAAYNAKRDELGGKSPVTCK